MMQTGNKVINWKQKINTNWFKDENKITFVEPEYEQVWNPETAAYVKRLKKMIVKEAKTGTTYTIEPPSRETGNVKLVCPACSATHSPGKQRNKDLSFNLETKVGNCHRCGASFFQTYI